MCDDIVNKYKYTCVDCYAFNKQCIDEPYDDDFITPFKKIPNEMLDKYIFYYCNSVSDLIYHEYIKSIYPENLYSNIFFDITNNSHGGYIAYLLNNNNFLLIFITPRKSCGLLVFIRDQVWSRIKIMSYLTQREMTHVSFLVACRLNMKNIFDASASNGVYIPA